MNKNLVRIIIVCLALGVFCVKRCTRDKKLEDGIAQSMTIERDIREGDILFQITSSSQCRAIQLATKSKYSHCGIVYKDKGELYVFEAVQPVKLTSLDKWIARGKEGHYVVKRLKNASDVLTLDNLVKMKTEGEKMLGKDYDLTFEWSDDRIYCSELVWKIYKRALDIEVGQLQQLKDFDLTSKEVKGKLEERYGTKIPLDEEVVSPADIFNSELLREVSSN